MAMSPALLSDHRCPYVAGSLTTILWLMAPRREGIANGN
jgi:hypothetical protein